MKNIINDWAPETKDIVCRLIASNFTIRGGNNGEEHFTFDPAPENLDRFIENLIACDEAQLYVTDPSGHKRTLFLVLGNSPGEIVSDYTCPANDDVTNHLDPVTDAHYEKWSKLPQPTKPSPYVSPSRQPSNT